MRIISSIIGLPLLVFFITGGSYLLWFIILIVSIMGMVEFYTAVQKKHKSIHFIGYLFAVLYFYSLTFLQSYYNSVYLLFFSPLFIISLLLFSIFNFKKVNIFDCAVTLLGFYYIPVLLSFICLVRDKSFGEFFVWLIFICAWGCDTGAYFVGILFGKHKLAPALSPKKTIEGALGGVAFATLFAYIFGFIVSTVFSLKEVNIPLSCTVIGLVGSVFAQFGDLAASAIKRYANIKDFGRLIPGHGGILDRFDSILLTAPGVFFATVFLFGF